MKTTNRFLGALGVALLLTAAPACDRSKGWSLSGKLDNMPVAAKVALEGYNNGLWYLVDSLAVNADGSFAYNAAEPAAYPEIMRLTCPGKGAVYFPVADADAVILTADAEDLDGTSRLSGTPLAAEIAAVDSTIRAQKALAPTTGVALSASSVDLRNALICHIVNDTTGLVAYYAVGKSIAGQPVFNPKESFGNKAYGAAAQVYATYHPEDPRGHALRKVYLEGRLAMGRIATEPETVIEVPEQGIIDIERYDSRGELRKLSDLVGKDKVVLLSFTGYSIPSSPEYNSVLNNLYELYSSKGLEIYQISFDNDEVAWRQAAVALPWTAVWNSMSDGRSVLYQYNVSALPTTFVINREGVVSERVEDPAQLPARVARYF